jgi:Flp pilus assembly protein TadD
LTKESDEVNATANFADQNPHDVVAQLRAAYAYDKLGDDARALQYYEAALPLNIPNTEDKKFRIGYGSSLSNNNRLDEAIRHLKTASQIHPESSEVWVFLSIALRKAERFDEAYLTLLRAIVLEAGEAGLGGFVRAVSEYLDEFEK